MGVAGSAGGVLPICGVGGGQEARRVHVLLPGGVGPGRREAADRVAGVPGHGGRAGRGDARRRSRAAGPGAAQGLRRSRGGLGNAGGPGRGRPDRCGGRAAAGGRGRVRRDVPGAGGAEPAGRAVLQTAVRGVVGDDGSAAVHQNPGHGAGSPPVLGRDARRHAGAAGGGRAGDHAAGGGDVRAGLLVGGAGHDQLRHLHRYAEQAGTGRAARQGQAETLRPAPGRAGPGGDPGRRDPADLARLPRR